MVEMLGGSGYAGLGLDGLFQCADGGICWDFEREEIVVVLRRRSYAYCDTHCLKLAPGRVWWKVEVDLVKLAGRRCSICR